MKDTKEQGLLKILIYYPAVIIWLKALLVLRRGPCVLTSPTTA